VINSRIGDIFDHQRVTKEFPRFREAKGGMKAVVNPGDILFTPAVVIGGTMFRVSQQLRVLPIP
jgi:hypothetical protein